MSEQVLLAVISQAVSSIKKVRSTLLVAVFGSVFVFICAYNTFPWGWMTSGKDYNSKLNEWCSAKSQLPQGTFPTSADPKVKKLYDEFENQYKKNTSLCTDFNLIKQEVSEKNYISRKYIEVPFTTVVFDVNDLGLFSGVFLALVTLVLWYNLGLKYSNIYIALNVINEKEVNGNKKTYFDLLSMAQILSIPNENNGNNNASKSLVIIPYLLFLTPFITHLTVLINDISTFVKVFEMNPVLTVGSLIIEAILLVIILILCIGCINLDNKTDKLWESYERLFTIGDEKMK
ncbi:MAG: hypothetical protein R3D00_05280 [Bacteroidia bacterium]